MKIKFENIILRDMIESDIENYVRWFTTETEWTRFTRKHGRETSV